MLSSIREAFSKGILRYILIALMGLLVCSFAIWGIGDVVRSGGSRDVAKVGGIKIGLQDYQTTYQRETRLLSNRLQRPLTPADLTQMGFDKIVLNKLITDALLDNKVADMKLSLSDETLSERIRNAPNYKNAAGVFDRLKFQEAIREYGYGEADYLESERKLALRQQLASSMTGLKSPPQVMLSAVNAYRNEKRVVDFVVITAKEVGAPSLPTQADLAKYFEERKLTFRAPEYRKITVVSATKATLTSQVEVNDDEVKAAYEKLKPTLTMPEKRELQRVNVAAGETKTFDDLVKEKNLTEAQLVYGNFTQEEIIDEAIAKAAFALKIGETTPALQGTFGAMIVRLKAITPATVTPYEDKKDQLKAQIYTERFSNKSEDIHDAIDKERASGLPLADIATKLKFSMQTFELDSAGRDVNGAAPKLEEAELVVKEAFDSNLNAERDPIKLKDKGGYIWVEVSGITPARERKIEEVTNDLTARYVENELRTKITAYANDVVKQVQAGATLAAASKLKPETTGELTRLTGNDRTFGQAAIDAVFTTPVGQTAAAASRDPVDRIVFKVTDSRTPAMDATAKETVDLGNNLVKTYEEDLLTQYIAALKKQYGVTIDEVNFKRAAGGRGDN
jgi:peptidyl-prolyl cis-trans isomerase D